MESLYEKTKSLRTYTPSLSIKQLREVLKKGVYEEGKIHEIINHDSSTV